MMNVWQLPEDYLTTTCQIVPEIKHKNVIETILKMFPKLATDRQKITGLWVFLQVHTDYILKKECDFRKVFKPHQLYHTPKDLGENTGT